MNTKSSRPTLSERVGGDEALALFIHLIAEGRSLLEISRRMPGPFSTKGKVAGVKWWYKKEVETLLTAYIVAHGPIPQVGNSKPFGTKPLKPIAATPADSRGTLAERDKLIAQALVEWDPHAATFKNPFAFAAMRVNSTRRAATDAAISNDIIRRIVESAGGVKQFLKVTLKLADDVAQATAKRIGS